ncbi:MAG: hypothetical protein BWK75_02105 [Candidatus Altiarchaeales archaeon A3]|nr:MAG: hypothetical protein BWK75_02105 [Candidatus Altiarchaeales archaeon A3]
MSVKTIESIREKFHNFFISHDKIKYFVWIYIILALIVAVMLNLFAFLVLILAHYFMDVYSHIHNGYSKKFSLLKSLQECKIDFMFFFVGLGIDMVLHFAMAAAAARGMGMFGNLIRAVPRIVGIINAAKGTTHLIVDLLRHGKHNNEEHLTDIQKIKTEKYDEKIIFDQWDYIAVIVSFLFMAVGIFVLASNGYTLQEIADIILEALNPFEIHAYELFGGESVETHH